MGVYPGTVSTERLVLRRWRDEDRAAFAVMNADPQVMEFFPASLTRAQSDAFVDRLEASFDDRGFGMWAVQLRATGEFLGCTGLLVPLFRPEWVEIGWRLARPAWGHGYASEAARAALNQGFADGIGEIVSFTAVANVRSQAVMRRIGMTRDARGDFDHPGVPDGHHLRRHVLYRLGAPG